jgi:hypothetical protein
VARRRSRLRRIVVFVGLIGAGAYWWRRSTRVSEPEMLAAPSWPPLDDRPSATAAEPAAANGTTTTHAADSAAAADVADVADVAQVADVADVAQAADVADVAETAMRWVASADGGCPDGYPVKATKTGVYHVLGGQFYARASAERCYATPAAAEADGYRASKR